MRTKYPERVLLVIPVSGYICGNGVLEYWSDGVLVHAGKESFSLLQ
jgi:hypothetical protein